MNERESSELTEAHLPCPLCDSTDAYSLYSDGHGYCYSCEGYVPLGDDKSQDKEGEPVSTVTHTLRKLPIKGLPDRNISQDTCKFYGVIPVID